MLEIRCTALFTSHYNIFFSLGKEFVLRKILSQLFFVKWSMCEGVPGRLPRESEQQMCEVF